MNTKRRKRTQIKNLARKIWKHDEQRPACRTDLDKLVLLLAEEYLKTDKGDNQ